MSPFITEPPDAMMLRGRTFCHVLYIICILNNRKHWQQISHQEKVENKAKQLQSCEKESTAHGWLLADIPDSDRLGSINYQVIRQ